MLKKMLTQMIKKMLTQQKINKILQFQIPDISKIISHNIINNTTFWKYVTRPSRYIYVNCFNRPRFLVDVTTKIAFLDNLRTITHKGNMKTRQMTLFFHLLFSDLTVCNIHFWIWKYSKSIFMWLTLWSILVCKIPQFLAESYQFRQLITLF